MASFQSGNAATAGVKSASAKCHAVSKNTESFSNLVTVTKRENLPYNEQNQYYGAYHHSSVSPRSKKMHVDLVTDSLTGHDLELRPQNRPVGSEQTRC